MKRRKHSGALDAGRVLGFHFDLHWRGASERSR